MGLPPVINEFVLEFLISFLFLNNNVRFTVSGRPIGLGLSQKIMNIARILLLLRLRQFAGTLIEKIAGKLFAMQRQKQSSSF